MKINPFSNTNITLGVSLHVSKNIEFKHFFDIFEEVHLSLHNSDPEIVVTPEVLFMHTLAVVMYDYKKEKLDEILYNLMIAVGICPNEHSSTGTFDKMIEKASKNKKEFDIFCSIYSYLAQLVYLPHIFGYTSILGRTINPTCLFLKEEFKTLREAIFKGKFAEIIQNTVKSLWEISKFVSNPSSRESKFLQLKINEYAIYCSKSTINLEEKEKLQNEIVKFSLKMKSVMFSANVKKYQQIIMDQLIQHYTYCEQILSSTPYSDKHKDLSFSSIPDMLNFVPIGEQIIKDQKDLPLDELKLAILTNVKNTTKSFSKTSMEILLDYTLVTYLYENSEYMCKRVELFDVKRDEYKKKDQNQKKVYPKITNTRLIWKWMDSKIITAAERVKNDFNLRNTQDYVYKDFSTSQEICAYRDAWYLKEQISNGNFLDMNDWNKSTQNAIEIFNKIIYTEDESFSINPPEISCIGKNDGCVIF